MQTCIACNIQKPANKFAEHRKICNSCRNKRYAPPPKPKGFYKLPKETQDKIVEQLKLSVPVSVLAKRFGINYPTLAYWVREGKMPSFVRET